MLKTHLLEMHHQASTYTSPVVVSPDKRASQPSPSAPQDADDLSLTFGNQYHLGPDHPRYGLPVGRIGGPLQYIQC